MSTIQPSEVQWFLSNPSASIGYSGVGTPGNSLGKFMSTTQINSVTTLDDLFLDASGVMNNAGEVDYQCLFMANNTATGFNMLSPVIWLPTAFYVNYTSSVQIGLDPAGVVSQTSATAQAMTIANQQTAPSGVSTWVNPTATKTGGLAVPNVPPTFCVAIWFKRTMTNVGPTPSGTPDGVAFTCTFQSEA
jgi:hypothetical protein